MIHVTIFFLFPAAVLLNYTRIHPNILLLIAILVVTNTPTGTNTYTHAHRGPQEYGWRQKQEPRENGTRRTCTESRDRQLSDANPPQPLAQIKGTITIFVFRLEKSAVYLNFVRSFLNEFYIRREFFYTVTVNIKLTTIKVDQFITIQLDQTSFKRDASLGNYPFINNQFVNFNYLKRQFF